jgi:hypothetical protein
MWSDKEDGILKNANEDFYGNNRDFVKLINIKSAEKVKKRIDFLNIKMSPALSFYFQNILNTD